MTKTLLTILIFSIICSGCVSDPFITDSLAKLDRFPMHCTLPDSSSVVSEPFNKEKLLGEWNSGVITAPCRHIDGKGVYDSGAHIKNEQYGFFSDESFCRVDGAHIIVKGRYGELQENSGFLLKCRGKWSYANEVLTLNTQYYEVEITTGSDRKVVSRKTESCNKVNTFTVTCYDTGEIAIEERGAQVNSFPSRGNREQVTVDNKGVRTERTIKVTGIKDGKEVGVIDEKVIPPTRFKRQKRRE